MKNGLKGIIPAIIWFLLITVLLVMPGSAFPEENWLSGIYFDKIVHFVMFAVLVFLVCRGLFYSKKWDVNPLQAFLSVSFLASVYGLIIEFIQGVLYPIALSTGLTWWQTFLEHYLVMYSVFLL
ncbi:MAG: VanZ family protein [Sphingobacteriales bacterium]|nr:VanZ family protein [Sphingobacteriales bacterium]